MHRFLLTLAGCAALAGAPAFAADHLDTPTVTADPAADIGDLYAWTSADRRRLNLVMTIVGKRFSDQLRYVFHVDSGRAFPRTTTGTTLACTFDTAGHARCEADGHETLQGDVSDPAGRQTKHLRVFAGLRDDPYFNNVRGTRSALDAAGTAVRAGRAPQDTTGFHRFDEATLQLVRERWGRTEGGPAANFLSGWKTAALVVSVDLAIVTRGGPLLAVWGTTERRSGGPSFDRMGRPLTGNALLGTIATDDSPTRMKEDYNRAPPSQWQDFSAEIARNLALYDSFDGVPGNQWLADRTLQTPARYTRLASLLADDRLWIDSRIGTCRRYLAVERGLPGDCGGRTPLHDVNAVFRSLLIRGTDDVADDGVTHDDREHSSVDFPFLAAP
jgi:hypothetical protein